MLIGSRGCNGQSKGHKQQRRCENGNLLVRMICPPSGNFWDYPTGVALMRGNSQKVQRILANLHGLRVNASGSRGRLRTAQSLAKRIRHRGWKLR